LINFLAPNPALARGEQMVTESNTRRDAYRAIQAILDAGKPSGWSIRSVFPNVDTSFPCILIHPIDKEKIRWSRELYDTTLTFTIEIIVHLRSSPSKLDQGRDYIESELSSKALTLFGNENLILDEIKDAGTTSKEVNQQTYLISTHIVRWRI
jgi:hypothetical protein